MKWRSHGANPDKVYKQFNIPIPENVIDFSTNTNVITKDFSGGLDFKRLIADYPDDECIELRKAIAEKNNISIEKILCVNGTNEAIYSIISMYNSIGILHPTYSEYERAAKIFGKSVTYIYDVNSIPDKIDLFILCNPNNPTGKYYGRGVIDKLARHCAEKNIVLVIDEAYIDFLLVEHRMININDYGNVYILRSLTKSYSLAGIRLGYVLADCSKIESLKMRQPTWSVNSIAQEIGRKCILDTELLKETREFYSSETLELISEIERLDYKILPTDVHYFLMETENDKKLIKFMLNKGIVLRHTRNFPKLDCKYVRICTRDKSSNNMLIEALRAYSREDKI